jgi:hypothetical protein
MLANQRVTGNLIQAIASLQGQASFQFSLSLPVTQVHCKQCITDLSRKEVRSLGLKKSHKSVSWQDGQFPQTNEILWIFYNEGMKQKEEGGPIGMKRERERDIRCEGNWQPSSTQESFLDQCGTLSPCH